ncbi:MAG: AAA family ATPase [Candidatus Saccharimonadales bacterium]
MKYKRINIIGPPGSGKTTLARKLAKAYELPIIHMDKIAFSETYYFLEDRPGFIKKIKQEAKAEKWIMEGVYKFTLDFRVPMADLTIYLDLPPSVYVYRIFKRRVQYRNKIREEMPESWNERIDPGFLKYVLNFSREQSPVIRAELSKYPKDKIVTLRSSRVVKHFLSSLK